MSKTVEIGYMSATDQDYSLALRKVKTLGELQDLVEFYKPLTDDAIKRVAKMDHDDFEQFKIDLRKASRAKGKTAERIVNEWGEILLPATMLMVSLMASLAHAPFGVTFIRLKEMGKL